MRKKSQHKMRAGCLCVFALLAGLLLTGCQQHRFAGSRSRSFDFVQMCDPQIGFTDYQEDLARFQQATEQINTLRPDFVVIAGDLVNGANDQSFTDFNAAKARLRMSCHVAPGNHDLGNRPSVESLTRYRRKVGKDYYSFRHKGCLFVVANSQLWKSPVAGETERQNVWLARTLEKASTRDEPVFVVMHYPPFVKEPDEADNYFNLPLEQRRELLTLFRRCGVVAVLAGHTHTTSVLDYHGMQIVTSASTSRNFDKQPFGFRVWHVGPHRPYQHEFVPLHAQGTASQAHQ